MVGTEDKREATVRMALHDPVNPYQALLARALTARGARIFFNRRPSLLRVLATGRRGEVLNLHWQDLLTKSNAPGARAAIQQIVTGAHLLCVLAAARLRGMRVVWTVHNLAGHEAKRPALDRALGYLVARLATSVLVHSEHAAAHAALHLRSDVEVARHGSYIGYYPAPARSREETRRALGFPPNAHVIIAFGQVSPYKRPLELISAFEHVCEPRFRLLIAGRPVKAETEAEVRAAAANDPRISLILETVPEQRVRELYEAADVAAIAYRDVFSSGALMLALSCGVPVVAPSDSAATELAPPPVVQPYRPGGLTDALRESAPTGASLREEARAVARRCTWEEMAAKILEPH
jgi:beta-1,4-mannosyltransferase